MWVRGLKHFISRILIFRTKSHPMWVRGLKHPCSLFGQLMF